MFYLIQASRQGMLFLLPYSIHAVVVSPFHLRFPVEGYLLLWQLKKRIQISLKPCSVRAGFCLNG